MDIVIKIDDSLFFVVNYNKSYKTKQVLVLSDI